MSETSAGKGSSKESSKSGKATAEARRKDDRLEEFVELQKEAIRRWSDYSLKTARLAADGKIDPKEWIESYAQFTSEAFGDFVKLIGLMVLHGKK